MKLLNLGAGNMKKEDFEGYDVVTLDADRRLKPDIVCTLGKSRIKLPDNSIDHVFARHVLEHIGRQGETKDWFYFWEEIYRVMKPMATLEIISPRYDKVWAWCDPSHTRVLAPEAFYFFDQNSYRIEGNPISPYRIKCDFFPVENGQNDINFWIFLKARKPLSAWWN